MITKYLYGVISKNITIKWDENNTGDFHIRTWKPTIVTAAARDTRVSRKSIHTFLILPHLQLHPCSSSPYHQLYLCKSASLTVIISSLLPRSPSAAWKFYFPTNHTSTGNFPTKHASTGNGGKTFQGLKERNNMWQKDYQPLGRAWSSPGITSALQISGI